MPSIKLTKRAVEELPLETKGQRLYRDNQLPGFGVRVGTKNKTYFAEGQVNRRTRRVTIGRADLDGTRGRPQEDAGSPCGDG